MVTRIVTVTVTRKGNCNGEQRWWGMVTLKIQTECHWHRNERITVKNSKNKKFR